MRSITDLTIDAKANGHDVQFRANPVYDAVQAKIDASRKVNAIAGLPTDREAAFRQAIKPFTGAVPPPGLAEMHQVKFVPRVSSVMDEPLPAKYSSRDKGWVPPVRNQAACGSCWCFAGVGITEIAMAKAGLAKADEVNLSEQEILTCGPNGGCNGDWPSTALEHMLTKGTADESQVPYRAVSGGGVCTVAAKNHILSWHVVAQEYGIPTYEELKRAIFKYGAVAVTGIVDDAFSAYGGGVFQGGASGNVNHAEVYTGWDDLTRSFEKRNNWGPNWGEAGYMRITHGANQYGFGAMYCEVKQAEPAPKPDPKPEPKPTPPEPALTFPIYDLTPVSGGMFSAPKYVATPRKTASVEAPCGCDDMVADPAPPAVGFSLDFIHLFALAQDVFDLINSSEAKGVQEAVLKLIADGKAHNYGALLADVTSSLAAIEKIVPMVNLLIGKYFKAQGVQGFSTQKFGDGKFAAWLIANGPALVMDLVKLIALLG